MEVLFDLSEEYDAMLNQGLAISGENKLFFIEGRLKDIRSQIPKTDNIKRILDFGCGIGDATARLAAYFPDAVEIVGTDLSDQALEYAQAKHGSDTIRFVNLNELDFENHFDLCYVNGVFHHIEPENRVGAILSVHRCLKPGGYFALCENNPWNPGTQLIMSRIPFDRDAIKISYPQCHALLRQGGFQEIVKTRFLFYFPRALSFLRPLESLLTGIPLGGQYYVLSRK